MRHEFVWQEEQEKFEPRKEPFEIPINEPTATRANPILNSSRAAVQGRKAPEEERWTGSSGPEKTNGKKHKAKEISPRYPTMAKLRQERLT